MEADDLHQTGDLDGNTHADLISSPPPEDLPKQDLQDTNLLDTSGPFEPEMLTNLPQLTIQQLSKLEDHISSEFAKLAQEYVAARKSRVEFMQKSVDAQIKKIQHNDTAWSDYYNQQVDRIESLATFTENRVIKDNTPSRHHSKHRQEKIHDFEALFKELTATLELPLDFDDIFKHSTGDLPFAEHFKEIVDLHKTQLLALLNQIHYQSGLTNSITEKNRVILWKQYRDDIVDYREKLISQTRQELENLHKEYYGINAHANSASTNMHYYRSVVPVDLSKSSARRGSQRLLSISNHDKYHGVDNVYYRNNRIEVTDTKLRVQESSRDFAEQQNKYKIPQLDTVTIKLSGCMGLTKEEGDADLALIRLHLGISVVDETRSDEVMYGEDLEFSNYSHEVTYDSDEEDYHSVLNMDRWPTGVHTGRDL